jgi:hypothetical protein
MSAKWDPRDEPEPIPLGRFLLALVVFLFVIVSFVVAMVFLDAALNVLPEVLP